MKSTLLAADIGGTKTLLALAEVDGEAVTVRAEARYRNDEYVDFDAVLARFLDEHGRGVVVDRAALGVAGPREGGRVRLTNRPWTIDAEALSVARLAGAPVRLLNDLEATACGIDALAPDDLRTLQAGVPQPRAAQLVIGAGTGLGVAYRIWRAGGYEVIAGEGGHTGYAPIDAQQMAFWRALHERHGRVSTELVVSGAGLARAYAFLGGAADTDPAEVSALALERGDARAAQALALFAASYGAAAGDHALAVLARGGVYLTGGIAPKVLRPHQTDIFLAAFNAKGRHAGLAASMPVHVVNDTRIALRGALRIAVRDRHGRVPDRRF